MENKEVERILKKTFDIGHFYVKDSISIAFTYIKQLEKENAELKKYRGTDDTADAMIYASMVEQKHKVAELEKQLQAKDKALEKACGKIEYETQENDDCPSVAYGFVPKCCGEDFCEGSNKECWKEWCENETTN